MKINLSKDFMEESFLKYLEEIFLLPEVIHARVRDVVIDRDHLSDAGRLAFDRGYHDCYSDVDLTVKVRLPAKNPVTPEAYMKRIDRFGVTKDTALGWFFVPENSLVRLLFKNGMRYDLGFDFDYAEEAVLNLGKPRVMEKENKNWPLENIHRFWFVQIQALGKLYRNDYLISSHLANMNCNETLVMQMVQRDLEHGTNHHRYGYSEELEYTKDFGKVPYKTDDPVFNRIADRLYAAALSYDRLARQFYPEYRNGSDDFFAIWDCYHAFRNNSVLHAGRTSSLKD